MGRISWFGRSVSTTRRARRQKKISIGSQFDKMWLGHERQAKSGGGKEGFHADGPVGMTGRLSQSWPVAIRHVMRFGMVIRMVQVPVDETRTSSSAPSDDMGPVQIVLQKAR